MKFQVGDKVKIINYGHIIWYMEGESILMGDLAKDLLGQTGTITDSEKINGHEKYAIHGIETKRAWFNEDQLELI
jgi:hypothetical protein